MRPETWRGAAALVGLLLFGGRSAAQPPAPLNHPFAEHRIVLQLSDKGPDKEGMVLSVANNLLKLYGPDKVAIEVVAFGPGVDLLRIENPESRRVDSLVSQGVRFDVCLNTIETIERKTGKRPELNPNAVPVQAGVARIVELSEQGYAIVRP